MEIEKSAFVHDSFTGHTRQMTGNRGFGQGVFAVTRHGNRMRLELSVPTGPAEGTPPRPGTAIVRVRFHHPA
jgi:hypothetical protein